jgi:4-amino-4-deoxy-L-arabinose transferase-like glycosyltransferase
LEPLDRKSPDTAALAAIILLAAFLRFYRLGGLRGYDVDEAHIVLLAQGALRQLPRRLAADAYPPLYLGLLNLWTRLGGLSEAATRALSALIGTLTVALVPLQGRRILDRRVCLAAGLLLALAPLHVYYSREARMYALLVLGAWEAFYFLCRALDEDRPRHWAGLGAALLICAYTHTFGVLFLPAVAAALLSAPGRSRVRPLLATLAAVCVLYAPWVPVILGQMRTGQESWIAPFFAQLPAWAAVLRSLGALGAGGRYPLMNDFLSYHDLWMWGAALSIVLGLAFTLSRRPERPGRKGLVAAFLLAPLLILWGISLLVRPVYIVGRYDVMAEVFFVVAAAWGALSLPKLWRASALAAFAALSLYTLWPMAALPSRQLAAARTDFIRPRAAAGDVLIVTDLVGQQMRLEFLKRGFPLEVRSFPAEIDRHPDWVNYELMRPEALTAELDDLAGELEAGNRRVWVIPGLHDAVSEELLRVLGWRLRLEPAGCRSDLPVFLFVPRSR